MKVVSKHCIACDRPLKGRADKKFCDDYCRNNYNNRLNSDATPLVRTINNALRRNRRILEMLLPASCKTFTVTKKKLLEEGFQFQFITHTLTTHKGGVYCFCYEYGYLPLENDMYLLVKQRKDKQPEDAGLADITAKNTGE